MKKLITIGTSNDGMSYRRTYNFLKKCIELQCPSIIPKEKQELVNRSSEDKLNT